LFHGREYHSLAGDEVYAIPCLDNSRLLYLPHTTAEIYYEIPLFRSFSQPTTLILVVCFLVDDDNMHASSRSCEMSLISTGVFLSLPTRAREFKASPRVPDFD
jgi:hypothetical protein